MSDVITEKHDDKSYRVNGWREPSYVSDRSYLSQDISDLKIDASRIEPICIKSVADFLEKLLPLPQDIKNPLLYRGHARANYYNIPLVMRNNYKMEDILLKEFIKRFPEECAKQPDTFSRLSLMQHYGLNTRLLDVTENPLAALYFACSPPVKFNREGNASMKNWGTILLFRSPEEERRGKDAIVYEYKYHDSNTVNIMANTSLCEHVFSYGDLDTLCIKDERINAVSEYMFFKDIVRRSVIVRPPQNSARIRNQRGCFIICNCNKVKELPSGAQISPDEFTRNVIAGKGPKNLFDILNCNTSQFGSNPHKWSFKFEKIEPYSLENSIIEFQNDPFELNRLLYKNNQGKQVVFFIPPACKKKIIDELANLNITDSFIYPEMDTTADELNRLYAKT